MKRILFVLLAAAVLSSAGCGLLVSDSDTVEAVAKQGYSDVHILHIHPFFASFFGCSNGDVAVYKMSAMNSLGRRVNLIACAGWPFKAVTVRTE
jgi:hypothetical protein